jgi:hypothetical protein
MQEITSTGLAIAGRQFVEPPFDGCQAPVDGRQPGGHRINRRGRGLALRRRWVVLRCNSRTIATET